MKQLGMTEEPGDFDAWGDRRRRRGSARPCPAGLRQRPRAAQKERFRGELFPAEAIADPDGTRFLDYFQRDKLTGEPKAIVSLDLEELQ
jgi:hypothetical protein